MLKDEKLAKQHGVSPWTIYMIRSGRQRDYEPVGLKQDSGKAKACSQCHGAYRFETDMNGLCFEVCKCGAKALIPTVAVNKRVSSNSTLEAA